MRIERATQLLAQSTLFYQTRLISTMDLERNQLNLSLLCPTPKQFQQDLILNI